MTTEAKVAPSNPTPIVLSGIRPTGEIHLGNYFGAIRHFIDLQETDNDCLFFVADLHALTTAMEDKIDLDAASICRGEMTHAAGWPWLTKVMEACTGAA